MKYIKLFENRFEREVKYEYLEPEDREKVLELVIGFMDDKKIIENINELTYSDFQKVEFDYKEVWGDLFSNSNFNLYQFINSFHIKASAPAISNSLFDMLDELYEANDVEDKLDQQLIKVLEEEPKKYKKIFSWHGDKFNSVVINACSWMLDFKKYNL